MLGQIQGFFDIPLDHFEWISYFCAPLFEIHCAGKYEFLQLPDVGGVSQSKGLRPSILKSRNGSL